MNLSTPMAVDFSILEASTSHNELDEISAFERGRLKAMICNKISHLLN